jgi:hypothetical protein
MQHSNAEQLQASTFPKEDAAAAREDELQVELIKAKWSDGDQDELGTPTGSPSAVSEPHISSKQQSLEKQATFITQSSRRAPWSNALPGASPPCRTSS